MPEASNPPFLDFVKRHTISLVALGVAALLAVIVVVWCVTSYSGARNGLIDRESGMNAQYQANQAELDAFVKKVNEEFQVAGVKRDALDKVLSDAVKGRYDNTNATPATPNGNVQSKSLISALQEAYPNLGGLDVYDRIVTEISSGRENFKQVQVKLLDMIRDYESYRKHGLTHSFWINRVGYPELQANLGRLPASLQCGEPVQANGACVLHGKLALAQMHTIVTSGDTSGSFATGQEGPLTFTTPTTVK